MRRREFITFLGGTAAAWPLAARAQQPRVPVIGYLSVGRPVASSLAGLRKGLSEQGYAEGRNVELEFRETEQYDRLPALAAELVRRRVAVIVTGGSVDAALAAKAATETIPIVFTTGADPVRTDLVASLNRPGGNLTGVTFLSVELGPKRLEMLHELVPKATTIAYLVNPTGLTTLVNPTGLTTDPYSGEMQTAARSLGLQIIVVSASTASELEMAFANFGQQRAGGLLISADALFTSRRDQLVALAAHHGVPTVYFSPEFTAAGGLMSYSDDRVDSYRQAGLYVGRILKGEKPADLPVQQPTKFDFVINLKTAKTLGVEFPPSFHLRATAVIE